MRNEKPARAAMKDVLRPGLRAAFEKVMKENDEAMKRLAEM
ncbi:MAG TPA: hypothetical protein VI997_03570 [Candidatus Thermoplasmatota archaeon]|nr:hypothetical protein [Candidatus Thermoplasmatota archaeon]